MGDGIDGTGLGVAHVGDMDFDDGLWAASGLLVAHAPSKTETDAAMPMRRAEAAFTVTPDVPG